MTIWHVGALLLGFMGGLCLMAHGLAEDKEGRAFAGCMIAVFSVCVLAAGLLP